MHWIALLSAPESAASPEQPADPRMALAWWALSFTPRVTLQEEAVLMEVSSCERLWGGRRRLLERIFESKEPSAPVHAARSATSLVALGLLRLAAVGAAKPDRIPEDLPLGVLSAAQPHLPTLARIGCRTFGDLRALPRAGVARRFGAALLDALDRAFGKQPETHVWLTLPERFDAQYELPALAENASALMFGARRLLTQLGVWLAARQLGVIAFELVWLLDARRSGHQSGRTTPLGGGVTGAQRVKSRGADILPGRSQSGRTTPLGGGVARAQRVISRGADIPPGRSQSGRATPLGGGVARAQRVISRGADIPPARQSGEVRALHGWAGSAFFSEGSEMRAEASSRASMMAAASHQQQLVIRTGQATQDLTHLARLLTEQLARITLPAPAHGMRLRSLETARLALASDSLMPEDRAAPAGGDVQQLIERLAARLGPDQVLHAVPHADHRPERMQRWQSVKGTTDLIAVNDQWTSGEGLKSSENGQLLPTWLLREPLPLALDGERPQFHGPLRLLAGPERLEAGWWAEDEAPADAAAGGAGPAPALRDYFIARSQQAGLLWIYRERLRRGGAGSATGEAWFLHGVYA